MPKSKTHKTVYSAINPKLFKRFETVRGEITRSTFLRLALEAYLSGVENGSITPKVPAQRNSNPERFEPKAEPTKPRAYGLNSETEPTFKVAGNTNQPSKPSKPTAYSDMNGNITIPAPRKTEVQSINEADEAKFIALAKALKAVMK